MDSQLEQHEYLDRTKLYQQRLAAINTNRSSLWIQSKNRKVTLLEDLPAPDKTLAEDPITAADRQLVCLANFSKFYSRCWFYHGKVSIIDARYFECSHERIE